MRQGRIAVRLASLLAGGAFVLHQASGWLGGAALAGHGHSYLPLAAALVTVLLALACAGFMRELWQASRGHMPMARQPSGTGLWLTASAALLATFALQEWIEGWITPGHPASPAHAVAHIGWAGPVLALLFGALVSLLLRGSREAVLFIARRASWHAPRAERGCWTFGPPPALPSLDELARNRAGRGPPLSSFA